MAFSSTRTAPTEIYTLSLHDALPISTDMQSTAGKASSTSDRTPGLASWQDRGGRRHLQAWSERSEEHTSELQSRPHLVCRLLLVKKNPCMTWRLLAWLPGSICTRGCR